MELTTLYLVILSVSLSFLFAQLLVKKKQTAHILFAVFCGSIAIMVTKKISGEYIGAYQYIIGMLACATCNGYWLLSRSLFREKKAISAQHIYVFLAIALLIVIQQGYSFINYGVVNASESNAFIQYTLRELTILLSSCILVLSFWEGCRGFKKDNKIGQAQRLLFLATFGLAIIASKAVTGVFSASPSTHELIINCIILFVLVNTQILMFWRLKHTYSLSKTLPESNQTNSAAEVKIAEVACLAEHALAKKIESLIVEQKLYLQANLKVADIARLLDLPEYKISRALRHELKARNFNQYINELRIEHAKSLLADPNNDKWPVLVVGLESGFASVGPFTRTFKTVTGFTPNQYRQSKVSL